LLQMEAELHNIPLFFNNSPIKTPNADGHHSKCC
jgi:hypothetical protein